MADFISNSERIVNNLHSLPQHDIATQIKGQMEGLSNRFGMLSKQFDQYEKDLKSYKEFVEEQVQKRDEARDGGDLRDEGYAGQKLLVERLDYII